MPQAGRNSRSRDLGLRASDADRERVAKLLRDSFGDGRLSEEDLSERVDAAYDARTMADLEALTADLESPSVPAAPRRRRSGPYEASVRIHLTVFLLVNLMLIGIWAASGGGYFWPIWPILGWGIGVGCHAAPLLAARGSSRSGGTAPALERPRPSRESHRSHRSHRSASHRSSRSGRSDRPGRSRSEREDTRAVDEMASSVAAERPNLRSAAAPDGTVTILFSDIEGSTTLNERLGDIRWLELLREHNRIVREQVLSCGGYEVKSQGDGFMIAFPSARRAIECARDIQSAIGSELGEHPDGPVRVRIGLHTGEALRDESDFYGKNVVVAARITDQARGGEILASSVVKQLTESGGDIGFEDARDVELAGLAGTHAVYKVV